MAVKIVPWQDLPEEDQRAWVKMLTIVLTSGGKTLYEHAADMRLWAANRLPN